MNHLIPRGASKTLPLEKKKTAQQIIDKATAGRRRPLRGLEAVHLARQLGLGWELTGTGHKPGTLLRTRGGIRLARKGTCRKCEMEYSDGKPRCGYCHFDFAAKAKTDTSQASTTAIRHLVMDTGSFVKVEVDDEGHVFKPAKRPTKKQRNALKRELKAQRAMRDGR